MTATGGFATVIPPGAPIVIVDVFVKCVKFPAIATTTVVLRIPAPGDTLEIVGGGLIVMVEVPAVV